jgi:hypothetical protein
MMPELPDGTRIEFEYWTDVYAAWRDDESSRRAGWPSGDGGKVWCVYPSPVPKTWIELNEEFGWEVIARAVRWIMNPHDKYKKDSWPTEVYWRTGEWPSWLKSTRGDR